MGLQDWRVVTVCVSDVKVLLCGGSRVSYLHLQSMTAERTSCSGKKVKFVFVSVFHAHCLDFVWTAQNMHMARPLDDFSNYFGGGETKAVFLLNTLRLHTVVYRMLSLGKFCKNSRRSWNSLVSFFMLDGLVGDKSYSLQPLFAYFATLAVINDRERHVMSTSMYQADTFYI